MKCPDHLHLNQNCSTLVEGSIIVPYPNRSARMMIQATPICGIQITRIRGRPLRIVTLFNSLAPPPPTLSLSPPLPSFGPRDFKSAACSRARHVTMTPSFSIGRNPYTYRQCVFRCIRDNGGLLSRPPF